MNRMDLIYVNRKRIDDQRLCLTLMMSAIQQGVFLTPLRVLRYSSLFGIAHDLAFDRATAHALGASDRRRLDMAENRPPGPLQIDTVLQRRASAIVERIHRR
jgi:hypothetical protein